MIIHLDKVPLRQQNMQPFEILLSESQERMLVVVKKGREKEINLIEKGGNYGWNLREGHHAFVAKGATTKPDTASPNLIAPIWEYHHDVGKSITGGHVYRGHQVPELVGCYLYADYVAGKMWALRYDHTKHAVVANREIRLPKPILTMSFGEDEEGEVYFMAQSVTPQCVYRFSSAE